ncbi:uncharacterized protein LOC132204110 isoform X2 [Neocloeon triangulifer]|uniref:uncharacterized protein LOC132204110 isoform X2 n=1 Tax=Neocloeon triangulifer TaxID=2078957 RepID=UPI00286F6BCE|nr:uncharacterized protein LOC132204110 isoform X2 [Neocloeon triangulifer]
MVVSITLDAIIETGPTQGYPEKPAKLGCFENGANEVAAGNVFVLVVHYDFKDGQDDWPRPGNEKDVENLRKTFAENRNCAFRECSPKREDLLALLQDEQKLRRFIGTSEEPDVFFLIVLSHGAADGVIFTDFLRSSDPNDYENFTTNELFKTIEIVFPKCLKSVFLGPCRGQLEDRVYWPDQASKPDPKNDLTKNQNSSRVSFEPKMRNLLILYSTVETTKARRGETGTWLVKFLCAELNEMRQKTNLTKFLTGIQNRIHLESTTFRNDGQTPEFKMFPCDRKFIFQPPESKKTEAGPSTSGTDAKGKVGTPVKEKPRSIDFDWWNPKSKKVLRGRRAVIFHYGEENELIRNLDNALTYNLGFETINAKIDKNGLNYYFSQSEKSWSDFGCFAAFFFAEIAEQEDGQVCIRLNENEKVPIGKLIHRLLGPKNGDWIGKPKLFFLVDTKFVATDSAGVAKPSNLDEFLRATNHCGWLVFTLQNANLLQNFIEVFEKQEIKNTISLQESLANLLSEHKREEVRASDAMMVSTLPHQLFFPILERNFVEPKFRVEGKGFKSGKEVEWEELLESRKIKEKNGIWLLSSLSGSGKSTVMRELAFELQRQLKIKVFFVVLLDICCYFSTAKKERRKVPSLASVVSHATGTRELEIQNLIDENKVILMFDGFDEICPFYRDQVLQVFAEAFQEKLPIWISSRPHEKDAILATLGKEVCKVQIRPLDWRRQIKYLMMISNKSQDDCRRQIDFCRENGLFDILGNPLHLKMIAELTLHDSDYKKGINLYKIYEKIVDTKLCFALKDLKGIALEKELNSCEMELRIAAIAFLNNGEINNLINANNGIVTISDGRAHFVHQTFAEFLAAAHFIDCLFCEDERIPFDISRKEFRQVRKFVDLKISSSGTEKSNLSAKLKKYLENTITKACVEGIFLEERLVNFSSAAANLVTFNPNNANELLNYIFADQILVLASERVENFALCLLENGAYEKLTNPEDCAVKMLAGAIENNFALLFSKVEEKCANLMKLVRNDIKLRETLTLAACRKNHHQVFRLVLEKGIVDSSDQEYLQKAMKVGVRNKSAECVELLIEYGARTADLDGFELGYLNIKTTEALLKTKDEPILKLASRIFDRSIKRKNAQVAKFLMAKFGDAENAEFEVSSEALIDVLEWDDHDSAKMLSRLLVEKRDYLLGEKDKYGRNAFHSAAWRGHVGLVKYFLEKDPELVKTLTEKGENTMHLIFTSYYDDSEQNIEMCKILHNLDAEMVRQKAATNETMLHVAAEAGKVNLCKWLVEEIGLEVDAVDDKGYNAMHFAVYFNRGDVELLEYLHGMNADLVKRKTKTNKTMLHLSVQVGNPHVCKWLVEKIGLEVDTVDDKGWNAMHFAASNDEIELELLEYLHRLNADLVRQKTKMEETVLHLAAKRGKLDLCEWLVAEAGFREVDAVDVNGWNAVHFAAYKYVELDLLEYLHGLNADLFQQKTKTGKSVLHLAAGYGRFDTCKWLVEEAGVEVDAVDENGYNVMHFAAFRQFVKLELLEYLHAKNPQLIEKKTKYKETALHLASSRSRMGKVEIYNWFVKKSINASEENSEGETNLEAAKEKFL